MKNAVLSIDNDVVNISYIKHIPPYQWYSKLIKGKLGTFGQDKRKARSCFKAIGTAPTSHA